MSADRPTASFVDATCTHDPNATRSGDANATAPISPPAPPDGAPDVPGYDVLGELDRGGMGVVYRAREIAFDRDVALKVLQDRYAPNSLTAKRFRDEARITAQLQHPAIPPVHHIGTLADGRPFLAMKLIKGDTLAELLTAESRNFARFVPVFAQVCQAVAYAHSRHVIHRDLKPANVMVGAFAEVQVMDWGLAKLLNSPPREQGSDPTDLPSTEIHSLRDGDLVTQAGSILGTPAFMAPEQAQGAVQEIDERSDVFGLGAVLCMILTGQPPYTGPNSDSVRLKAIRGEMSDALTRLDACGADPELVALCRRCLAIERDARPRHAGEVAQSVAALLAAAEERARQAELDQVRAEGELAKAELQAAEQRKRRRVQRVLAGAVLLVLVLAVAGMALLFYLREARVANEQLTGEQKRTETARDEAERQRGIAEGARDEAEASRGTLRVALGELGNAHAELQKERMKLAIIEYGRTMQVAYQEWRDSDTSAAIGLLGKTLPEFRGWEWLYVHRLCHSNLVTLKGRHSTPTLTASFSPDGSRIVTASMESARVSDANTGSELFALRGYAGLVLSATFSADGMSVVGVDNTDNVRVWDAKDGKLKSTVKGGGRPLFVAVISPDGTTVATSDGGGTVQVRGTKDGIVLSILKGHADFAGPGSFCQDGTRVTTMDFDYLRVWDVKTGSALLKRKLSNLDTSAVLSPDGARIVVIAEGGVPAVIDVKTGATLLILRTEGHHSPTAYSPDGAYILTSQGDDLLIWDAKIGTELFRLKGQPLGAVRGSFSRDGTRIVSTGTFGDPVRVWATRPDTATVTLLGHENIVSEVAFSRSGALVVTASHDKTARVWNAKTGEHVSTLNGHLSVVRSASFTPNQEQVLTCSWDGTARLWDVTTGKELFCVKTGNNEFGTVTSASLSPDGAHFLIGEENGTATLWDVKTRVPLLTFQGKMGGVAACAFSPDGNRIVTGGIKRTMWVWNARTGAPIRSLSTSGQALDSVASVAFSADGTRVVAGGSDGKVRIWDVETGAEMLNFGSETCSVTAQAFSLDGRRLVTVENAKVIVRDANTGAVLLSLGGRGASHSCAAFSTDGIRIVTGNADGTVTIWDATPVSREVRWPATAAVASTIVEWESPPTPRAPPREAAPPPRAVVR